MDEIKCPKCGSKNWRCWDERQLDWWHKDGSMAATQVIGCMACNDCQSAYADVNPSDKELLACSATKMSKTRFIGLGGDDETSLYAHYRAARREY